jgi:hypothetical protein
VFSEAIGSFAVFTFVLPGWLNCIYNSQVTVEMNFTEQEDLNKFNTNLVLSLLVL